MVFILVFIIASFQFAVLSKKNLTFKHNLTIPANGYLEFQKTFIEDIQVDYSSAIVSANFSAEIVENIARPLKAPSPSVDLIIFKDLTPLICYKHSTELKTYTRDCNISNNSATEVYTNISKENLNIIGRNLLNMRSETFVIVLDNTPFLHDPKTTNQVVKLTTTFFVEIDTIKTYYFWTIGLGVSLACVFVVLTVAFVVLMLKFKNIKKKHYDYILGMSKSNRESLSVGGRMNRPYSFREEDASHYFGKDGVVKNNSKLRKLRTLSMVKMSQDKI